jgi:tetratricopeptide (TPR) repeat protein
MKQKQPSESKSMSLSQRSLSEIATTIQQAEDFIAEEEFFDALELLLPLIRRYPRETPALELAANVYAQLSMPWQELLYLRQASDVDPTFLFILAEAYAQLELQVLSMLALRRLMKFLRDPKDLENCKNLIAAALEEIQPVVCSFGGNQRAVEEGLRLMEEAQVELNNKNYDQCIRSCLLSTKILKNYPPPLNNLSLAYFFSGQWKHAIQIARNVLLVDPGNLHARANLVHYLAWTGGATEAQTLWHTLRETRPIEKSLRLKLIETAAIMDDDLTIYEMLHRPKKDLDEIGRFNDRLDFYLAIAEANLGKTGARALLSRLAKEDHPGAQEVLKALRQGKKGRGSYQRFSYYLASEYLPTEFHHLITQTGEEDEIPERTFKTIKERIGRYPQLILAANKMIYEEDQVEAGCQLLVDIATPESYKLLYEFGTGQIGSKQERLRALNLLVDAGQIPNGSLVKYWDDEKWTEVRLRRILISDTDDRPYSIKIRKILDEGLALYRRGKKEEAKRKFTQALELEPQAKEAWNNLGTIFSEAKEEDRATDCLKKALEIDPLYILPRCNLAQSLISQHRLEEAAAMLEPLEAVEKASSQAMAHLAFTRARLAFLKEEYDQAEQHARLAVKMNPDLQEARDMLNRIQIFHGLDFFSPGSWFARDKERQKKTRERLREKLTNLAPSITEVLGLYSREILQAIARIWVPSGGWSTYKKAQLLQVLQENMRDPSIIGQVIEGLKPEMKSALLFVKEKGGVIDWQEFAQIYDNDSEESLYWQYHQPETIMGRLRLHCLLAEATVEGKLVLAIPQELRPFLEDLVN